MSDQQRKRKKGRKVPRRETPDQALARLEAMHDKVAGLLHVADQQDHAIRGAARMAHDQTNEHLEQIAAELERQYPNVDPELAQTYGRLLQQRKHLHGTIVRDRKRSWDEGHQPPI